MPSFLAHFDFVLIQILTTVWGSAAADPAPFFFWSERSRNIWSTRYSFVRRTILSGVFFQLRRIIIVVFLQRQPFVGYFFLADRYCRTIYLAAFYSFFAVHRHPDRSTTLATSPRRTHLVHSFNCVVPIYGPDTFFCAPDPFRSAPTFLLGIFGCVGQFLSGIFFSAPTFLSGIFLLATKAAKPHALVERPFPGGYGFTFKVDANHVWFLQRMHQCTICEPFVTCIFGA